MNIIARVAFIIFCFFAAIACYTFGVPVGGIIFVLLGVVFEGLFWLGIFGGRKKMKKS